MIEHTRSAVLAGSFSMYCKCGRFVTMQTPAECLVPMPDDGRPQMTASAPIERLPEFPDLGNHVFAHRGHVDACGNGLVANRAGENKAVPGGSVRTQHEN